MATLTTVVVFLPMMLMNESFFMKFLLSKIGMPVVFALVSSLFVALIFIPLAAKRFGDAVVKPDPKSIGWMRKTYQRMLGWTMVHRRDAFLVVVILFASIWWPIENVKQTDQMQFSSNRVTVRMWGPNNFTIAEMDEIASDVEHFVAGRRDKYKIVLVDMINRLRQEGVNRTDAILEAGYNRFRPILMTTCTTVFGLLPMAIGSSTMMGMPYAPLGITMMGGLIVSTLLTLLVVPLFYTFLDDLRLVLGRIAKGAFRAQGKVMEEPVQAAD